MGYYPSVNIKYTLLLHLLLSIPRLSSQCCDWLSSKCVLRNFTPYNISSMTMISHWICNCYSVVHQVSSWLAYSVTPLLKFQNILSWSKWMNLYSLTVFLKKIGLSIPVPTKQAYTKSYLIYFDFHLTIPELSYLIWITGYCRYRFDRRRPYLYLKLIIKK